MAEDWHKTPSEIREQVSVTDMYRWRLLRIARADAEEKRANGQSTGKPEQPKMELDPADLVDGKYLPDADPDS